MVEVSKVFKKKVCNNIGSVYSFFNDIDIVFCRLYSCLCIVHSRCTLYTIHAVVCRYELREESVYEDITPLLNYAVRPGSVCSSLFG